MFNKAGCSALTTELGDLREAAEASRGRNAGLKWSNPVKWSKDFVFFQILFTDAQ